MAQRWVEGLCFNCPEKFSKDHNCMTKSLYLMELDDDAPLMSAAETEPTPSENVKISLHALTGIKTADHAPGHLHRWHLPLGPRGFGVYAFIHHHSHSPPPRPLACARPDLTVGVANGDHIQCARVCADIPVTIGNEGFFIDLFVLPLTNYDLVMGCHWLKSLGIILWDFEHQTMAFW